MVPASPQESQGVRSRSERGSALGAGEAGLPSEGGGRWWERVGPRCLSLEAAAAVIATALRGAGPAAGRRFAHGRGCSLPCASAEQGPWVSGAWALPGRRCRLVHSGQGGGPPAGQWRVREREPVDGGDPSGPPWAPDSRSLQAGRGDRLPAWRASACAPRSGSGRAVGTHSAGSRPRDRPLLTALRSPGEARNELEPREAGVAGGRRRRGFPPAAAAWRGTWRLHGSTWHLLPERTPVSIKTTYLCPRVCHACTSAHAYTPVHVRSHTAPRQGGPAAWGLIGHWVPAASPPFPRKHGPWRDGRDRGLRGGCPARCPAIWDPGAAEPGTCCWSVAFSSRGGSRDTPVARTQPLRPRGWVVTDTCP